MRIKVDGLDKLLRKLAELSSERKQRSINRAAARSAINPVRRAMKDEAPVDSGSLKQSQATKVTGKGFQVTALAGPDINYVGPDGQRPGKYDHLVVRGHVAEDGTVVPPNDYVSRAASRSLPAAQQKYADKLAEGIEREATKS